MKLFSKEKVKAFFRNFAIVLLLLLFLIIVLSKRMFVVIRSGEAGVLYSMFTGTNLEKTYGEGLHLVSPFNKIYVYNLRVQKADYEQQVISRNGLKINVRYSVLFRPEAEHLALLHQRLGPDYQHSVVTPAAESWTRKLVSDLNPEQIYLLGRGLIERNETDSLARILRGRNIVMEGYMISYIKIPDSVSHAIESKYCAEQMSLEYDFKIAIEEKERERKDTEAIGLKEFESISGISAEHWKALDVTQKIGTAPNSKIIIMGNSSTQLPVLLNDQINAPR